jgi:hypothetical protein
MAMRFELKLVAAASALLLAAGCAPVDSGFGEALKYDMAAQTVNPDPQYPEGAEEPGGDGVHGAKAVERYRKGTTKAVKTETTSTGGSGGSGGGSGPQ